MIFRVQNVVRNFFPLQHAAEQLGRFHADRADQNRLDARVAFADFVDDGVVFFAARFVDAIVRIGARDRAIGRDDGDIQFVDVVKFVRLGFGGAGHAGELLIEAEIILDRDRGEGLGFAIDLDAFLRFDRLVQAIAPAAARHFAAGVFVDDDDFVFLDDVGDVLLEKAVGAQQLRDVVDLLGLLVALFLPLGFHPVLLVVGEGAVEIDVGEFADQIREDEGIGIVRIQEGAALLGEIGLVRFLVHGEEEFFLEGEEFLLARVLEKRELGFVDRPALFRVFHHAQELLVARLAELHLEHEDTGIQTLGRVTHVRFSDLTIFTSSEDLREMNSQITREFFDCRRDCFSGGSFGVNVSAFSRSKSSFASLARRLQSMFCFFTN